MLVIKRLQRKWQARSARGPRVVKPSDWSLLRTVSSNPTNTSFFGLVSLWIVMERLGITYSLRDQRGKCRLQMDWLRPRPSGALSCTDPTTEQVGGVNKYSTKVYGSLENKTLLSDDETDVVTFCMSDGITTRLVTRRTTSCRRNNSALCPQSMSMLLILCHNSHYILHTAGVAQSIQWLGCGLKVRPIVVRPSAQATNSLLSRPHPPPPGCGPTGWGRAFSQGVKMPKLEAYNTISSADVKNEWSLTCTPPRSAFMERTGATLLHA